MEEKVVELIGWILSDYLEGTAAREESTGR